MLLSTGYSLELSFRNKLTSIVAACTLSLPCNAALDLSDPDIKRFQDSLIELQTLDDNWDELVKGEGDNIRRQLGTVYKPPKCEPALCNYADFVKKFVKSHADSDLNLVDFEEPSANVLEALNQAEFLAYSSMFSENSGGGGFANKADKYIDDSHKQVKRALKYMKQAIEVLSE
jgi:hypothetical protein